MKMGTKSVLYGAHCFLVHWFFVARGWYELHGFNEVFIGFRPATWQELLDGRYGAVPIESIDRAVFASLWSPALWAAFFLHDIGYLGKPNMDGDEGEQHPRVGAAIMRRLFGEPWGEFVLYHSRFLAKQEGRVPSALCIADKLAITLEPWWFYLPRVILTGEIREYMAKSSAMNETGSKYSGANLNLSTRRAWHRDMVAYVTRWVAEHKDGREDTWTPNTKAAS